jgi:CRISPR-associated protein Cmr6
MADHSIRRALAGVQTPAFDHPGLALARYLKSQDDEHSAVRDLHNTAQKSAAGEAYRTAFARWEQMTTQAGFLLFREKLGGPLAIGLGNESVTEVGLTTHFTYGMPVIPGSAVKGLCRRGALLLRNQDKISQEQFLAIFGDTQGASFFTFWDAWYDPASVNGKPFHRDVITVHHPDYYGKKGKGAWPTDFDDPNPVPFLVVKPGAQFLFAIQAPNEPWGTFVKELIRWSLRHLGAGGKTNAGYGWFEVQNAVVQTVSPSAGASSGVTVDHEIWMNVTVIFEAGRQELKATYEGKTASVTLPDSRRIMDSLPEPARNQLQDKKRRKIPADVEVKAVGGSRYTITRIIPKE